MCDKEMFLEEIVEVAKLFRIVLPDALASDHGVERSLPISAV
jgi:hypothetical protein